MRTCKICGAQFPEWDDDENPDMCTECIDREIEAILNSSDFIDIVEPILKEQWAKQKKEDEITKMRFIATLQRNNSKYS